MGHWPEHLQTGAEFLSTAPVLQRQPEFKRSVLALGKRVRTVISLH
jgi:hypothetical protein